MGVKDLVGLFEPPVTAYGTTTRSESQSESPRSSAAVTATVHPTPARFIRHQTRQSVRPSNGNVPEGLPSTPINDFMTSNDHPEDDRFLEYTADVTDEVLHSVNTSHLLSSTGDNVQARTSLIRRHPSSHEPDASDSYTQSLLSKVNYAYPPDDNTVVASSSSVGHQYTILPVTERVRTRSSPHSPIPAVIVFSRKAATLFLPELDDYLTALPPPRFPPLPSRSTPKDKDVRIFPPMDRLVSLGRTLEDLETNSVIRPFWRNRKTLLGGLVNLFLGIMVRQMFLFLVTVGKYWYQGSSALASFYSLQGLFDTVQVFALILSTIGKITLLVSDLLVLILLDSAALRSRYR